MSAALRQRLLFSLLMSGLMAFLMTAWVTLINLGPGAGFFSRWMHAYLLAWPAAFLIVVVCAPTVQRITVRLLSCLSEREEAKKNREMAT